jgi:hypothetical protein
MGLKETVAGLVHCSPKEIGPDFSLDRPPLDESLGKSILIAAIRRDLGVECMAAASAKTYQELEDTVLGRPAAADTPKGVTVDDDTRWLCWFYRLFRR